MWLVVWWRVPRASWPVVGAPVWSVLPVVRSSSGLCLGPMESLYLVVSRRLSVWCRWIYLWPPRESFSSPPPCLREALSATGTRMSHPLQWPWADMHFNGHLHPQYWPKGSISE